MIDQKPPHEYADRQQTEEGRGRAAWPLVCVRYVLPVAAVIAGAIVMAMGSESNLEGGAGIIGAGLAIFAINWLYRIAFEGDRVERANEEAARSYLATHGHWPDEAPRAGESGALGERRFALSDGRGRRDARGVRGRR